MLALWMSGQPQVRSYWTLVRCWRSSSVKLETPATFIAKMTSIKSFPIFGRRNYLSNESCDDGTCLMSVSCIGNERVFGMVQDGRKQQHKLWRGLIFVPEIEDELADR